MKNKETLQAVMDRRLSFLDGLPSCRPALMQRIAQEEAPDPHRPSRLVEIRFAQLMPFRVKSTRHGRAAR